MKTRHIAMLVTSALLAVGLLPVASAQSELGSAQEGIEVITVVGKRPSQEGIEVITVVGKRPAPTVASLCVKEVMAGRATRDWSGNDGVNLQTPESRRASRDSVRQAIRDCIATA